MTPLDHILWAIFWAALAAGTAGVGLALILSALIYNPTQPTRQRVAAELPGIDERRHALGALESETLLQAQNRQRDAMEEVERLLDPFWEPPKEKRQ